MSLKPLEFLEPPVPAEAAVERAFVLEAGLALRIAEHCRAVGDEPRNFIADALVLALDEAEWLRGRSVEP